jgi:hypothetical protein
VQKAILGLVVTFAAVSCTGVSARTPAAAVPAILIEPTGSPFLRVTSGSVTGLVPHGWQAITVDGVGLHQGFVASRQPDTWLEERPTAAGIAATWIDATQVGVPSDLYYLPASGPLVWRFRDHRRCTASFQEVFADNVPTFMHGASDSTGDYVARGGGVCPTRDGPTMRWSYFVVAPGFGPAGRIGIPGSGLYLVVAATRESPRASRILAALLDHVRFGRDGIGDFVRAVQPTI